MTDEDLAAELAEGAGRLLLRLRGEQRDGGAGLGAVADKAANDYLLTGLARWRPQDPVLSEESPDCSARLSSSRVWIIDPLDGTREYGEGRDDWAVHVALAIEGRPALGAVAVPARGGLYRSDGKRVVVPDARERPLIAVSRSRAPRGTQGLADALNATLLPMGSAGAKAMAIVAGEADLYFHSGGQHEWDNCAPAAVALGLGLHASRADGAPLAYNRADTLVPDLIIGNAGLAARAVAWFRERR